MELIDKFAVVAEIKRRKELVSDPILSGDDLMIGERNAYFNLLHFLDTLEVKEVDLEKEIDECMKQYHMIAVGRRDFFNIAKHFFELRLNVRKEDK